MDVDWEIVAQDPAGRWTLTRMPVKGGCLYRCRTWDYKDAFANETLEFVPHNDAASTVFIRADEIVAGDHVAENGRYVQVVDVQPCPTRNLSNPEPGHGSHVRLILQDGDKKRELDKWRDSMTRVYTSAAPTPALVRTEAADLDFDPRVGDAVLWDKKPSTVLEVRGCSTYLISVDGEHRVVDYVELDPVSDVPTST